MIILIKKYTFTICVVGYAWIVVGYFLFEKGTHNGLFKVIDIQNNIKVQMLILKLYSVE